MEADGVTNCEPETAVLEVQGEPLQEVASVDDQVSVTDWPRKIVEAEEVSETTGATGVVADAVPDQPLLLMGEALS